MISTSGFWAWNMQESMKLFSRRFNGFIKNDRDEIALYNKEGVMIVSSTAWYRDFDYDLQLKNKGKIQYNEDFSDKWSMYMIGIAHRYGWTTFNDKLKTNNWRALSFDKDGKLKVTEYKSNKHSVNWKIFYNDFKKSNEDAVYLYPNGRVYYMSTKLRNRMGWSFSGLTLVSLWQQNVVKQNILISVEMGDLGIMSEKEWQIEIKRRTKFIDELKTKDDVGRWKTSHPFWIYYQWKSDKHNSGRGAIQYFRSYNYKYAFERFKNVVRKYEQGGYDITFVLITGDHPRRQVLLASDPMDDKGTQTLVGWLWWTKVLTVSPQLDPKQWWTVITKNVDDGKIKTTSFENADKGKAVAEYYKQYKSKGRPNQAFILLRADNVAAIQHPAIVKRGFKRGYQTSYQMMGQYYQNNQEVWLDMMLNAKPIGF